LFHTELALEAVRLPQEKLQEKAATFEAAAAQFDEEQTRVAEFISVDRGRLLKDLETATENLWREARRLVHEIDLEITDVSSLSRARDSIGAMLASYFDRTLAEFTTRFRDKLSERLTAHQQRGGALVNLVRQTAADLMEITVRLPEAGQVFEVRSEPYWATPEPALSLSGASAGVMTVLLPREMRRRRLRRQLVAEAERAVLRNVANLEWALRQNVEDAFRRFQSSLSDELLSAVHATREALQVARQRKETQKVQDDRYERELVHSLELISNLLREVQSGGEGRTIH
jgi:hypothetical protein